MAADSGKVLKVVLAERSTPGRNLCIGRHMACACLTQKDVCNKNLAFLRNKQEKRQHQSIMS